MSASSRCAQSVGLSGSVLARIREQPFGRGRDRWVRHRMISNCLLAHLQDIISRDVSTCVCPRTLPASAQDFRCGEWRNPLARGGLRSIDFRTIAVVLLVLDLAQCLFLDVRHAEHLVSQLCHEETRAGLSVFSATDAMRGWTRTRDRRLGTDLDS